MECNKDLLGINGLKGFKEVERLEMGIWSKAN